MTKHHRPRERASVIPKKEHPMNNEEEKLVLKTVAITLFVTLFVVWLVFSGAYGFTVTRWMHDHAPDTSCPVEECGKPDPRF
jgi:hypothetical protein